MLKISSCNIMLALYKAIEVWVTARSAVGSNGELQTQIPT